MDHDQLASEKPADQNPHFFHTACKFMPLTEILMFDWMKILEECSYKLSSMIRVYLICSVK